MLRMPITTGRCSTSPANAPRRRDADSSRRVLDHLSALAGGWAWVEDGCSSTSTTVNPPPSISFLADLGGDGALRVGLAPVFPSERVDAVSWTVVGHGEPQKLVREATADSGERSPSVDHGPVASHGQADDLAAETGVVTALVEGRRAGLVFAQRPAGGTDVVLHLRQRVFALARKARDLVPRRARSLSASAGSVVCTHSARGTAIHLWRLLLQVLGASSPTGSRWPPSGHRLVSQQEAPCRGRSRPFGEGFLRRSDGTRR